MTFRPDMNRATQYDSIIANAEAAHGLPEGLLKLTMMIENRNNPQNRVSPKGAAGVMQIMPDNFDYLGITDPNDPEQSINGAAKLYQDLLKQYGGDVGAAVAHYNGGNAAGRAYQSGEKLNPETAQYMAYAQDYVNAGGKTSQYGRSLQSAAAQQALQGSASDLVVPDNNVAPETIQQESESELHSYLTAQAEANQLSRDDAFAYGFDQTLTMGLARVGARTVDEGFDLNSKTEQLRSQLGTLNKDEQSMLSTAHSEADFSSTVARIQSNRDFGQKLAMQPGVTKAGMTAAIMLGGMLDPVALPIGGMGAGSAAIRAGGAAAAVGRAGIDAAVAGTAVSIATQAADKGYVNTGELLLNAGASAVFGLGVGAVARRLDPRWGATEQELMAARHTNQPEYQGGESIPADGRAVDFDVMDQVQTADGGMHGAGASQVIKAAAAWDESSAVLGTVQARRKAWLKWNVREKLFGWTDSTGVVLAKSDNKVVRFLGAQLAGNAAGLGKQEARNAAVLKAVETERLQMKYFPELAKAYADSLDGAGRLKHIAGGDGSAQASFSKAVQLERYKHRLYRREHGGSSEGYVSTAPEPVQRAGRIHDALMEETKQMRLSNKTEHSEQLAAEDSVGFMHQTFDYRGLQTMMPEKRAAIRDMIREQYQNEVRAKIARLSDDVERQTWLDQAMQRAKADPEATWAKQFLKGPNRYFEKRIAELEKKMTKEAARKSDHYFDNAITDPASKYMNSEANLLTLSKELAEEMLHGRTVTDGLLEQFSEGLTKRWADTTRREMPLTESRVVNGEEVHLLDAFVHDYATVAKREVQTTGGDVALAKLGWRTEQNIQDTLMAARRAGATPKELEALTTIVDMLKDRNRAALDGQAVRVLNDMAYATMMGKLPLSVIADLPAAIGNIGIGGMAEALGKTVGSVLNGSAFVKGGRPTKLGRDLQAYLHGLEGRDRELFMATGTDMNGVTTTDGTSIQRLSQTAAHNVGFISGAHAVQKAMGTALSHTTVKFMHKALRNGTSTKRLADVGLEGPLLDRVKAQFQKYGNDTEFGLSQWDDKLAAESLVAATHRYTTQSSMDKSYVGELPAWASNNAVGALFAKFRAVGLRAQEKVFTRNVTMADSGTVGMATAGIAFATMLAYARIYLDAATSKDASKKLEQSLTPTGVALQTARMASLLGISSELFNVADILSGGGYQSGSDTPLTGVVTNMGGAVTALGQAAVGTGEWSKAWDKSFKALPGGNTYLMLGVKKALED
ncbi:putative transglycosylase [Aeromonas phage LAh2]|uniref:Putative transglycosylase n=1 Tax=Aeromonas phage LAh1 TaxID=2591024 RepID=A0A513ZYZ0_9CAUD|nr:putative transglycosylase [Aeromonas phage LAh1]QDH46278.1 putative transglycosylase [Aeromonas phage LAh2]QDH46323.1 putative transglycosylase [Aeromonas phage LAh3]QDH46373.1 putative transglycosylase [Aeromonas phage LAh4]QDH46425.1 putative transglycosylase [Aeromonas phage LAh5]